MQKVHIPYSESESVKSDMRAAVETKVKLMMEEWTTTSGFLVTMVTVIERKTKLIPYDLQWTYFTLKYIEIHFGSTL